MPTFPPKISSDKTQGDSKKSWKVLNEVLNKSFNSTVLPNTAGIHSHLSNNFTNDIDLANNFNNYSPLEKNS